MNNQRKFFLPGIFIFLILLFSCRSQLDIPGNLKKLTDDERMKMIERNQHPPADVKIVLKNGDSFNNEAIMALKQKKLIGDFYVDSNKTVKLIVLRKTKPKDRKIFEAIEKRTNQLDTLNATSIDCKNLKDILEDVYKKDQENRGVDTETLDRKNQQIVLAIIQKCGFPALPAVDRRGLEAIFLVIQHGTESMRAKYYKNFSRLSENNQFDKGMLVLMEDRMLMDAGKRQKYGTQVIKNGQNEWELYPVDNIDSVNKRRRALGLSSTQEYLNNFR